MPTQPSSGKRPWQERISRTGYFVGAVFLHVIVFVLLAGYIVTQAQKPPPPDFPIKPGPVAVKTEPPKQPDQPPENPSTVTSGNPSPINPIVWTGPSPKFVMPKIDLGSATDPGADVVRDHFNDRPLPKTHPGLSSKRWQLIHDFEIAHRPPGAFATHDASGTYPVYVAQYADGDWDCNILRDANGNINAGSMPDLTTKIQEWSNNSIKATVVPKPLNIGGHELIDTKPPFIFFTGHKDFVLTEGEVKNLQDYVQMGGAIWGDNALAGKGSRFDVAFKREMKRVVPDNDCNFEPLDLSSDLFSTKEKFQIADTPVGMNYYREPIEHLDIDGEVAILYTPNDYSDLYAMRILPGDKQIAPPYIPKHSTSPLLTNGTFLYNERLFFRNFTLESSITAHRLGMNIVIYLITRFDDKLLLPP